MPIPLEETIGLTAGLTAAILWAIASVFYSRLPVKASTMTTFKNVFAAILMCGLLGLNSRWNGQPLFQASAKAWWLLGFSGVVGLLVGDMAFFRSLQILGPRRGLTITLLTPATTALLGRVVLREVLPWNTWFAILVTIFGIVLVMWERVAGVSVLREAVDVRRDRLVIRQGYLFAAIGIACQAVGSIAMKMGSTDLRTIEATFVRLLLGAVAALVVATLTAQWSDFRRLLADVPTFSRLATAAFLGTFLGVWMMLISFKHCPVGIAATLTATSPLFVIPIVRVVHGEKMTFRAILGATIAIVGVGWLLLGRP